MASKDGGAKPLWARPLKLVREATTALNEPHGSTHDSIAGYIEEHHIDVEPQDHKQQLLGTLSDLVQSGHVVFNNRPRYQLQAMKKKTASSSLMPNPNRPMKKKPGSNAKEGPSSQKKKPDLSLMFDGMQL